jgi:hypothetical protein
LVFPFVSLGLAAGSDFVFQLESCESLMVENLTSVSSVEVKMRMAEVHKRDASDE